MSEILCKIFENAIEKLVYIALKWYLINTVSDCRS